MNRSLSPWISGAAQLAIIVTLAAGLVGCRKPAVTGAETTIPAPRERPSLVDPVLDVIRSQVDALNREDLDNAIAQVDGAGPKATEARALFEKVFAEYDLHYKLESLAIEDISEDEARVHFVQVTEKVEGPPFRDNRTEGIHVLKRRAEGWKISTTETTKVEYLE